jgi:hypothetical protein
MKLTSTNKYLNYEWNNANFYITLLPLNHECDVVSALILLNLTNYYFLLCSGEYYLYFHIHMNQI